jgi:branched-chain amino acid transport system substrate-binding protein
MAGQGVERLIVADDRGLPGTGIGDRVASLAGAAGIAVVERLHLDPDRALPAGLTSAVRDQRPDAVLYGGGYDDVAVQLLRAVHAADSAIRLFGTDSLTLAPELPAQAGAAAGRLELIGVDPGATDGFDQRFEAVYGKRPDRQAIFGYRAMKLVLDAVRVTGEDAASRRAVIRQAVERTTPPLARFARYRVERDRLVRVGPPL